MNYTFTYINLFHKINKIYHKTLHFIFLNHYIKMIEVFFPKKCSPIIIFTKKDHTKKNRATHKPITNLYI